MTTTTEVAVIEPDEYEEELAVTEQLSKAAAKALDKKVRATNDRIVNGISKVRGDFDSLLSLLDEAANGEIHVALGLKSWTAWLSDAVQFQPSDVLERKELVALMAGKGLSTGAVSKVLGISKATAARDAKEAGVSGETTGVDGKTYSRPAEVIDAEWEEQPEEAEPDDDAPTNGYEPEGDEEEQDDSPTPAADLVREFDDEVANLHNALAALEDLLGEDKWKGARARVSKAHLDGLGEYAEQLQRIVDDLMS